MTWRRFLVLVEHLPPDSATMTFVRNSATEDELAERRGDATKAPWSSTDSLLATLIDEVRMLQWLYAQRHSKTKIRQPTPIPRPGIKATRGYRRIMTAAELKALDPRLKDLSDEEAVLRYRELTGRG